MTISVNTGNTNDRNKDVALLARKKAALQFLKGWHLESRETLLNKGFCFENEHYFDILGSGEQCLGLKITDSSP